MEVPVLFMDEGGNLTGENMVWGFPALDGQGYHINARGESISQKPTFAAAFRLHRAIVPASGFYEWQKEPGIIPKGAKYDFFLKEEPLYFGAVFCLRKDGQKAFALITVKGQGSMKGIHHRMPLMLQSKHQRNQFLASFDQAQQMLVKEPFSQTEVKLLDKVTPREQLGFL